MPEPDEITGIKDSRKHIGHIADLIGTTFRNRRLLLKSELLDKLDRPKKDVVEWLYGVDPEDFNLTRTFYGIEEPADASNFKVIERTLPDLQGNQVPDIQFVPEHIYKAYGDMAHKLKKDISGRMVLSSGYRSPAFQVLIMCYNIKRYRFDMQKVLSSISLPGYSEHGLIETCALDLQLSYENFLRSDRVEYFAKSDEFKWLQNNASSFGFKLSYPEGNELGMAFEPWHWRYVGD